MSANRPQFLQPQNHDVNIFRAGDLSPAFEIDSDDDMVYIQSNATNNTVQSEEYSKSLDAMQRNYVPQSYYVSYVQPELSKQDNEIMSTNTVTSDKEISKTPQPNPVSNNQLSQIVIEIPAGEMKAADPEVPSPQQQEHSGTNKHQDQELKNRVEKTIVGAFPLAQASSQAPAPTKRLSESESTAKSSWSCPCDCFAFFRSKARKVKKDDNDLKAIPPANNNNAALGRS